MDVLFSTHTLLALALGYLLGSIPFGLLLTHAAGYGDIREVGSGNIGATNVLRTGHRGLAALTLMLDAAKGAAAVIVAQEIGGKYWGIAILAGLIAGLGAVLGHMFPAWLRFRGGKGVATYIGVLTAVHWPSALVMGGAWLAMAAFTRYSSLSALVASIATPFVLWAFGERADALLFAILTALLIVKHRENIIRLLEGREPKIGVKV